MHHKPITFRNDRRSGDDALIVDLHRRGYAGEGARFDGLDAHVAKLIADADLDNAPRSRVWFAELGTETIGCAAMIDRGDQGQLRWVIVLPGARGQGAGRTLVTLALDHARSCGFKSVYLKTTDGLDASMSLYEALGFTLTRDEAAELWHGLGHEITMALSL